jgi:hypothetical protein
MSDAERDAAMTPDQHDRVATYHREQARLSPGIADMHHADAARHEAEAMRKRSEAMHAPMAQESRRQGMMTMRESMERTHAAERARAMHSASHGTAGRATPHDQAMHQAVQTGKKGGEFVISKSGKKRYVKG